MEYLLKASAVIAIFYICYNLFLQRETFFQSNRWFLLLGLITAFCIPFIVIPVYIEQTTTPIQDFILTENYLVSISEKSISMIEIFATLYFIGVTFFFIKFIIQLYSLGKVLINNKKEKNNQFIFIETTCDLTPFSFLKWIVFNPSQFNETELKQILTHEKVHAYQLHSIDILISQLATIILWFNPFIWLYKKNLQQNLEFIADNTAHHKANCKKSYQHLLLKTSLSNHQLALTNNFYNSLIKKRIVMLHKNRSKNRNLWKFTLILPVLALFLISFNTKEIITYDNSKDTTEANAENLKAKGDLEMVLITKNFTDADFKKIKEQFAKEGLTIKFKGIKRNDKGEITAIKIDVSSKSSNANYNTNSDDPINPIKISFDREGNNISIGNTAMIHNDGFVFETKDGKHKIHTSGKGNGVFVYESDDEHEHDDDNEHEHDDDNDNEHEHDENVFVLKKDGKVIDLKNTHNKDIFVISGDDGESTIIRADTIKLNGNVIIKDKKVHVIHGGDKNIWTTDDDKTFKMKTIGKGKSKFFISGDDANNPIFILDGKEVTKKVIDELDPDKIEKMEVLKGESATKKYGDKGKDGVILITTKTKE